MTGARTRTSKPRAAAKRSAGAATRTATKTAPNIRKPVLPASPAAPAPAVQGRPVTAAANAKAARPSPKKPGKRIRAKFAFPESDLALLAALKSRALAAGRKVKKAELLRAGLALLDSLSDVELVLQVAKVEPIQAGKPGKGK